MSTPHGLFYSCVPMAADMAERTGRGTGVIRKGLPLKDLVQESFVGLARAANTFEDGRGLQFSTHAHWKVRESLQQALRQRARELLRRDNHICIGLFGALDKEPSPLDQALGTDLWRYVTAGLSMRCRIVLRLLFYEGLSGEDAGEVLGITRAGVKWIKDKAFAHIRGRLRHKEEELCG